MGIMILLSVITLFLEPLISPNQDKTDDEVTMHERVWNVIETFFTVVFTLEFLIRLAVCNAVGEHTVQEFLKTPSNACDFVALLPFYVEKILASTQDGLRLLRTARLMKLIRLL